MAIAYRQTWSTEIKIPDFFCELENHFDSKEKVGDLGIYQGDRLDRNLKHRD